MLTKQRLLQAYSTMRTIREFEERLHTEFASGDIPGFVHLYAGEEAAATGVCMHLTDHDCIAMNLASVWQLPAIFVAENNGYAESTSSTWSVACGNIAERASGCGMPGALVDGFDFFAVYEAAGAAIRRAREGGGPSLIEVKFM